MAKKAKKIEVSEKYELIGISSGKFSVGNRIINTEKLDEETCLYLLSIKWPHIKEK